MVNTLASVRASARAARRKASSGIHSGGSQPQPGLSTLSSASSDCRETQNGSTSRSRRGSTSVNARGGVTVGET
ncbi:hypothetical protein ACVIJX_006229 [Bradyrhizobium diazoefficiens]